MSQDNMPPTNDDQSTSQSISDRSHHHSGSHEHEERREVLLEREIEILEDEVAILEEELELVEIELFFRDNPGKQPPRAKKYRIRVDNLKVDMPMPEPTGREILQQAGKVPPENFLLNEKIHGQMKPIGLDERVDLRAHGVERFVTLPKDQTEGCSAARRAFFLPEEDTALLTAGGFDWESVDSNGRWLLVHEFKLPEGFTERAVSAAIQIPPGYPSAPLDMIYFNPPVVRADGREIPATQASVSIDERRWQRWSRHYSPANPWKLGEYNVVTHLHLARTWLEAAAK